jgi:GNAT superfamily N-acetyltransferase
MRLPYTGSTTKATTPVGAGGFQLNKREYDQLNRFVEESLKSPFTKNQMIDFGPLSGYIRVATHHIDGALRRTLDIGRVEVTPKQQGKGHFSKFLNQIERMAHKNGLVVFVESIQNETLINALQNRGYQIDGNEFIPNASFSIDKLNEKFKAPDDDLSL